MPKISMPRMIVKMSMEKAAGMAAENAALRADLKAVAVALVNHGTIGAGKVEWRCNLCWMRARDKWLIQHKNGCPLARDGVRKVLEGVKDG